VTRVEGDITEMRFKTKSATDGRGETQPAGQAESIDESADAGIDVEAEVQPEPAPTADREVDVESKESKGDSERDSVDDATPRRPIGWSRVAVFAVLPAILLAMALGAGYLKWAKDGAEAADVARVESLQAAKDATVGLLSYQADTAQNQLDAASNQMTGAFKNEYLDLINRVVIPGAKEKRITAAASVTGGATVSASADRAVVLLFVNQSTTVGATPPTEMQSSVRVTMSKVGEHWLLSGFDPI